MSLSITDRMLFARVIPAARAGNRIVVGPEARRALPAGCEVFYNDQEATERFGEGIRLVSPLEEIPVLPESAAHPGQVIGLVTGPDWATVDRAVPLVAQDQDISVSAESRIAWTDETPAEVATGKPATPAEHHLVEGLYTTEVQLHRLDAPPWVEAHPETGGMTLRVPTQWPGHVRQTVAEALGLEARKVEVRIVPVEGGRDGALFFSSLLAVLAALLASRLQGSVRLALRADQMTLTGGRSPATIRYVTTLLPDGSILGNSVDIRIDCGAYPFLVEETRERLREAAVSLYTDSLAEYSARAIRTVNTPMGPFEGVGTAQVSFAREVHYNRLAGIAQDDPIRWRMDRFRRDWPVLTTLAEALAENSEFHRRYAANELVRKRRLQLPRNTTALKGVGCAFGEQISGMTGDREQGYVSIRLDQEGSARLHCSLPTPTPRLRLAWRSIVAQELQIPRDQVTLDTACRSDSYDSGPRIFSRGSSVIPRAITSACAAIQKQRFRDPLPIQVRRAIKNTRATRNPAEALRSLGGAAVEATLIPATMSIEVRSVTMVVYAGRIMDRQATEMELRRGIYQALSWTLQEAFDRESRRDRDPVGDPVVQRHYNPGFLGAPPKIKVVLLPAARRESPVGVGELPFLVVPAALVSALSQASGLYLDTLPVSAGAILRMLREEEQAG